MKISMQPALYNNTNIQPSKNSAAKSKQPKDSFELSAGPSFTGGFTGKNKIASLLLAAGTSLLVLAGCAQPKSSIRTMGGTGYRPDTPSCSTEEQAPTPGDSKSDAQNATTPATNKPVTENSQTPPAAQTPYVSTPPAAKTPPASSTQADSSPKYSEDEMHLQELEVRYHELESIGSKLGQINNDLDTARNELKTKQAEMEKAEEKLGTYDRKDPNDKPPGFEADYNRYVDLCNDVKGLQSLILKLEAEKANAETRQDEVLARVSELGGHPHLD